MAGRVLAAVALILAGSVLSVPIAILLGVVMLLLDVVHAAWARGGLVGIRYRRHLGARRSPFGETIPLEIEVWNRRRLPLAWLRADDEASAGVEVRERALDEGERPGTVVLRNAWTLRPWERVRRRFHVSADRRGVFTLGPVDLSIGDPFARRVAGASSARAPTRSWSGRGRSPRPSWSLPTAGETSSARGAAWPRIRPASRAFARTPQATRSGASTPGRAPASTAR